MSFLPVGFPGFPLDPRVRGHPHAVQFLEARAPTGTRTQHIVLFPPTPGPAPNGSNHAFPDLVLAQNDGKTPWVFGGDYPWGAFQLTPTDGTLGGGNQRGNGAVDLQFVRRQGADEVASGAEAAVLGNGGHKASANNAVVCGGGEYGQARGNTASGGAAFCGAGRLNTASGEDAAVVAGISNVASGLKAFIGAGELNTASGSRSGVPFGYYSVASLYGQGAHAAGRFAAAGDAQRSDLVTRRAITGTAIAQVYLDGASSKADLGTANRLWACELTLAASINTVGNGTAPLAVGNSFVGKRYFAIKRVTNDAGTALVGAVETLGTDKADANMAGAAITITADTTDGSAKIEFTPCTLAGSTTITRVVAHIQLTELGI